MKKCPFAPLLLLLCLLVQLLAPAAGAALDGMELEGFVGSLAGDDTAILIMRTSRVAEELTREIESMLEG